MNPVTGLSLGRIAVGAFAIVDPQRAAQSMLMAPDAAAELRVMTRLFGIREVAIGAATLVASGRGRTALVLAGVAVDLGDAATGYLAQQRGDLPQRAALGLAGVAVGAALSGLTGLRTRAG